MMEPNEDDVTENDSSEEAARLPMALLAVERASKTRLLFDVSTRRTRGVSSASVFPGAACVFENAGWLLMLQHKEQAAAAAAVFLVHPISGRRVDLPAFTSASGGQGFFVFYVSPHGAPLVVARVETLSFVPTVHVACPGDVYWSVYEHHDADVDPPPRSGTSRPAQRRRRRLLEPASIADVALVGTQAVCLDASGEVLVFDVAEMTWRRGTPAVRPDSGATEYERFLVAAGGELLLVSRPRAMGNGASFRFFRLDMAALEWSPLERRELDDAGWFLCRGQSFRAREPGKRKVYALTGPGSGPGPGPGASPLKSITNLWAYDLDDGSVEMAMPASLVTEACRWVGPTVFAAPAKPNDLVH